MRNENSTLFVSYWLRLIPILTFCTVFLFPGSALGQYADKSVLSENDIFKISCSTDGVHVITFSFLQQLGMEPSSIDPRNIHLYGNGGKLLSEEVSEPRIDDLLENRIKVIGEDDGSFDQGDLILFYGQNPNTKTWNSNTNRFDGQQNIYSDKTYYYLTVSNEPGLRIESIPSGDNPSYSSSSYDRYDRIEEEKVNLLDDFNGASGTGQQWFGDLFSGMRERTYSFDLPNIETNSNANFRVSFAARGGATSDLEVEIENQSFSRLIGGVNMTDAEGRYARSVLLEGDFNPQDENIEIRIAYPSNGSNNIGWLDYIDINTRAKLVFQNNQIVFSDHHSLDHPNSAYEIQYDQQSPTIWDISSPNSIFEVNGDDLGSSITFAYPSTELKHFVAFSSSQYLTPEIEGQIDNQNLHGLSNTELIIVYHPDLEDAAELLVQHRSTYSNMSVTHVTTDQIFNEFGSGQASPVAIRDFVKMAYDRFPDFNYLLLLGDASFDYKNLNGLANPSNLVPTYETKESLDPIRGFPSDDFFGLLSEGEGSDLKGALDIAIGRLPAQSNSEALDMVHKIIDYETNPQRFGDWINKVTFVADDEDFNIHLNQADQIAEKLIANFPGLNIDKIYLDAFRQVSTAGGELYPDVQMAINNNLFKGTSVINYMGHGGSTGFAQERILTLNDVNNWVNQQKLALFVTATCSFTGYDDPNFVTAGERAILNPNGGAIALFTTVRAVYSSSNERLTSAVFENLYNPVNGQIPPLGEILRIAKNSNAADTLGINARKFLMIGDPSMHLIRPQYEVSTTHINDREVVSGGIDTLGALQEVSIRGEITSNGLLKSDFTGSVEVTIFDKSRTVTTLGQDPTSFKSPFETRKNLIFKGIASVNRGKFNFSFVVPQDIDYQFGSGKISYYAQSNNFHDASGFFDNVIIGGTSPQAIVDDQAPEVRVFLDDENFEFGGITRPSPTLLVHLNDDNGINIVGNGIGHDITAVLDEDTRTTIVLNEFYESELDNTRAGTIRFPLSNLKDGRHSVFVKAWDIANNSGSARTEFIVASDENSAFNQILNYPNPVVDQTTFRIDHNISGGLLDINIDIYSIDGRLVRTLKFSEGGGTGLIDNLEWDAKDNTGRKLNTGVYLFKVRIQIPDSERDTRESKLEKLVILR